MPSWGLYLSVDLVLFAFSTSLSLALALALDSGAVVEVSGCCFSMSVCELREESTVAGEGMSIG